MDKENITCFSSPVIQKNTPIKRLGLSRKRKSSDPVCNLNSKIQASDKNIPVISNNSEENDPGKVVKAAEEKNEKIDLKKNYDEEIDSLLKRINEGEEKLKSFQNMKIKIDQLEDLINLWKNGCKNAFLHFRELLKERQSENIDMKSVLNKLGIWEVMLENFGSDSEISLIDYEQ